MATAHVRYPSLEPCIKVPVLAEKSLRHRRQRYGWGLPVGRVWMLPEAQAGQRTPPGQKIDANQRSALSSSGNKSISSLSVMPLPWARPVSVCAIVRAPGPA